MIPWYVFIFVIRKLKSLSLSLFGIDIGYGNKMVGLRQGDEIKARFQGHSVIPQIYFATMLSLLFFCLNYWLFIRILPSVLFLPMTIFRFPNRYFPKIDIGCPWKLLSLYCPSLLWISNLKKSALYIFQKYLNSHDLLPISLVGNAEFWIQISPASKAFS